MAAFSIAWPVIVSPVASRPRFTVTGVVWDLVTVTVAVCGETASRTPTVADGTSVMATPKVVGRVVDTAALVAGRPFRVSLKPPTMGTAPGILSVSGARASIFVPFGSTKVPVTW